MTLSAETFCSLEMDLKPDFLEIPASKYRKSLVAESGERPHD